MSDIKIAGNLTIKDWKNLEVKLKPNYDLYWDNAYIYFETRINTRYIKPIEAIKKLNKKGEGFAIVNLQCSLIETIESFICGIIHIYPYFYLKNSKAFKNNNRIYVSFFNRFNDKFNNLNGKLFFSKVRNPILHETQTKSSWKILAENNNEIAYFTQYDNHTIYRNNFQDKILEILKDYKDSIIFNKPFYGIPACELRENYITKFNHICNQS